MAIESPKQPVDWSLKDLDNDVLVRPQFPLDEGVAVSLGGELAEQKRFGFQDTITHWTTGKTRTFTFESVLYARNEDEGEDVLVLLEEFERLATKDDSLGRPPICLFTYGSTISETVIVQAIDPRIVDVLESGNPREVRLSVSLRKYEPFSQGQIDPTKPAKESFFLVATAAERSYEAIALRFYGDPLLGDRLRKRHPEAPLSPEIGQIVKVPSKSLILSEVVEPSSHILNLTDEDAVAAFEVILNDRNARRVVEVV